MQRYAFFDSENGDRVYSAQDWARIFRRIATDGYISGEGTELQVTATDPVTLGVEVGLGAAWVQGHFYQVYNDVETLSLSDADLDNDRIDRIVVRLDYGERLINVYVKEGTPATSPTAPSLTRDSSVYELSLAQVYVPAQATSVSDTDITDERNDETLFGQSRLKGADDVASDLEAHKTDQNNPHNVTASQVGAPTTTDFYELSSSHADHTANTNNPHSVTASQVGAPTTTEFNNHTSDVVIHRRITGGKSAPDDAYGNDGDVYFQYS